MAALNVGADPINPSYYAGTACAEIIEHQPTNVGFASKYAWRLGEKDSEAQEAGKAIWYLQRQQHLKHDPRAVPDFYVEYARTRIKAAVEAGKLNETQAMIVTCLVGYTLTALGKYLQEAIDLFQTYLD